LKLFFKILVKVF